MINFFKKKQLLYWLIIVLPLLMYLIWGVYSYTQVGLIFIKWHTHLVLYAYIALIIFIPFVILKNKISKNNLYKIILLIGSIWFSFFVAEIYLTVSGKYLTSLEKHYGHYLSPNQNHKNSHYHTHNSESKQNCDVTFEFDYCKPINKNGYADIEWEIEKKNGETRILTFGDSFIEGVGAPFDSSFPAILRNLISIKNDSVIIMNAGVSGSDPFFDFKNLKDKLLVYKPDIVVQFIGSNDMDADIILRGGNERFVKDGLKFKESPWWEPIYAISYLSRVYFNIYYNENLTPNYLEEEDFKELNLQIIDLTQKYIKLCDSNDIKLVVVMRPALEELEDNGFVFDFSSFLEFIESNNIMLINLLPQYIQYIESRADFFHQYYWSNDRHHNSKGYDMMAKCMYKEIIPLLDSASVN